MKLHAHGRVCADCGEPSRVGNRVGPMGYCRLCYELKPRRLREWLCEKHRDRERRAA